MNYNDGLDLINQAIINMGKDKLFFRWVTNYEKLGKSYEEFERNLLINANYRKSNCNLSGEEILNNVMNMMKNYEG